MKRPSYREAIRWIVYNDDCEWMKHDQPMISVSAALVADMFGVDDERIKKDLRRALEKDDRP